MVGKVGTAPIFRAELERELGRQEAGLEDKILDWPELALKVAHLQAQGKKVVFTNGCFDLLHGGHIKFLEDSRRLGDALVVALDTDASVRRVKGEGRPVIGEAQRRRILAALEAVDFVTVFESAKLPEILASLKPDILTKGSNYPEAQVAGPGDRPGLRRRGPAPAGHRTGVGLGPDPAHQERRLGCAPRPM